MWAAIFPGGDDWPRTLAGAALVEHDVDAASYKEAMLEKKSEK
ncbi:MAG TPA: hypothetical protein VGJ15_01950 [Pirellulales bacterium]|jgi:hypothetical protein